MITPLFDEFITAEFSSKISYLNLVKSYYEKHINIPSDFLSVWDSPMLQEHFINDCKFMAEHTIVSDLSELNHDNLIFENGQGLLLCDTGEDRPDTTPSDTGINYALYMLRKLQDDSDKLIDITAHYVTRPYLTRHGDGFIGNKGISKETCRSLVSSGVQLDRTNKWNEFQGDFRYGVLDINELRDRIVKDSRNVNFEVELTHCDEMDREKEFKDKFKNVNIYDSPLIK